MIESIIGWLKQTACSHAFAIEDLHETGIAELEKPATNGYAEWSDYYRDIFNHESYTERVAWPCAKCGKVFHAHCGLEISPDHGPTFRRGDQ